MDIFLKKHEESILGVIEGFDRIIFKGYLTSMFPDGAFGRYLYKRGVLLKDAGKFFESETEVLIQHAKATAKQAGRPYHYLECAHTHASGQSKEAMARAIAEQDGISEGLLCIFSVLEPCRSFAVAGNRQTQGLELSVPEGGSAASVPAAQERRRVREDVSEDLPGAGPAAIRGGKGPLTWPIGPSARPSVW